MGGARNARPVIAQNLYGKGTKLQKKNKGEKDNEGGRGGGTLELHETVVFALRLTKDVTLCHTGIDAAEGDSLGGPRGAGISGCQGEEGGGDVKNAGSGGAGLGGV